MKINTIAYKIPTNKMIVSEKFTDIKIYKKRVRRKYREEGDIEDKEFNNYFTYEYEDVSGIFKSNKKLFYIPYRIYRIKDYTFPFLIQLNFLTSMKFKFINGDSIIQNSKFWYNLTQIIISFSLMFFTYLTYLQNTNQSQSKANITKTNDK